MDFSVVRQPIFNRQQNKVAYQISFMNKTQYSDKCIPMSVFSDRSDPRKLNDLLVHAGLNQYSDNKVLIITFEKSTFKNIIDYFFSSRGLVIELSKQVVLDTELLDLVQKASRNNYFLMMDDRVLYNGFENYLKNISHVKISVKNKKKALVESLINKAKKFNLRIILDDISSYEEFKQYSLCKVDFFKGDVFSKQNLVEVRTKTLNEGILLNVFQHVMADDYCYKELTSIFESDIKLTHKLISFLNTSLYGRQGTIGSIKQAVCFMGENNMRKFISLLTAQELTQTRTTDIYTKAVSRARFCELVAINTGKNKTFIDRAFLVGLFSNLPDILGLDIQEALDMLKVNDEIKKALLGQECELKKYLESVIAFEQADWQLLYSVTEGNDISPDLVGRLYNQMIREVRNNSYLH
jgi:EAL and modified HD-GYP domain-containing signal transduction protein